MIFAIVNDYVIEEIRELNEEEVLEAMKKSQCVVSIEGMIPAPQIGWTLLGSAFTPPVTQDQAETICQMVYDPMVKKMNIVRRRFIGENILWGITQMGKTRAVGDFMAPIETWFNRSAPIPAIEEIELKKIQLANDPALAASLAPFVTISRLNWYRSEIMKAAGMS